MSSGDEGDMSGFASVSEIFVKFRNFFIASNSTDISREIVFLTRVRPPRMCLRISFFRFYKPSALI